MGMHYHEQKLATEAVPEDVYVGLCGEPRRPTRGRRSSDGVCQKQLCIGPVSEPYMAKVVKRCCPHAAKVPKTPVLRERLVEHGEEGCGGWGDGMQVHRVHEVWGKQVKRK